MNSKEIIPNPVQRITQLEGVSTEFDVYKLRRE